MALNRTWVAPQRFVPVMITLDPIAPLSGEKDVIVGGSDGDDREVG